MYIPEFLRPSMKRQHVEYDKCRVAQDVQVGPRCHESVGRRHDQVEP